MCCTTTSVMAIIRNISMKSDLFIHASFRLKSVKKKYNGLLEKNLS